LLFRRKKKEKRNLPISSRPVYPGCGSGSGFNHFVDPDRDPYLESGSRGKEMKRKNLLFSNFFYFYNKKI
jgi:hypothetical protein